MSGSSDAPQRRIDAAEGWRRAEVCVRGVRLSYLERESGAPCEGAPVLLLHGLVASAASLRQLGEEFPRQRRVVALDMPGGGYSARPATSDASFGGVAELVAEAMTALGMEWAVVVGHSYGGAIAMQLAVSRPERVDALILIAPAHPFSRREDALVSFYLSRPGRWVARLMPKAPKRMVLESFRRMPGDRERMSYEQIEPYLQTLRHPGTVAYVLRLLASWKSDMAKLGAALREGGIEAPALLLWGELDPVVPAATGDGLMRRLGGRPGLCELVFLPGTGHLPNDERPEECGALIRSWLTRRELRRGAER